MANGSLVERVALMLTTAAAEEDWRRTWARVNRAAGMVAHYSAYRAERQLDLGDAAIVEEAGEIAEDMAARIAERVTGPDPRRVSMVVKGLSTRVGRALVEWFTGTSPEEGRVRPSGEGPEDDRG